MMWESGGSSGGKRLLVVSARGLEAELGRTVLWRSEIERTLARDADAALEAARAAEPSLVVVDADDHEPALALVRQLRRSHPAAIVALARAGHAQDSRSGCAEMQPRGGALMRWPPRLTAPSPLGSVSPEESHRLPEPFSDAYAAVYDLLYADKDYASECRLLDEILSAWDGGVRSVVDLGCGTGVHACGLARKGYAVTGVDRSPAMLASARRRASDPTLAGRLRFARADVRELRLGERFDAALAMFAVLGYQTSDADLEHALGRARDHLREGGAFVFDGWWGPGVLRSPPTDRTKTVERSGVRVVRRAHPRLDREAEVAHIHYTLERFEGARLVEQAEETHSVRFHFRETLEERLARSGLRLERLRSFGEPSRPPTPEDWTYLAVAQAR